MTARRRQLLVLVAAGALALAPRAAEAGDGQGTPADLSSVPRALASNGAIIPMPEIGGLSCRGMAEVMGLIDQARYRESEPVPEWHPDREIFEYEDRLSAAYYQSCILTGHRLEDPGPAFGHGFEQR